MSGDRGAIRVPGGASVWAERAKANKPKIGRRRTATLSVSLKIKLKEDLQELCEDLDVTVSEWVSAAIEARMELDAK